MEKEFEKTLNTLFSLCISYFFLIRTPLEKIAEIYLKTTFLWILSTPYAEDEFESIQLVPFKIQNSIFTKSKCIVFKYSWIFSIKGQVMMGQLPWKILFTPMYIGKKV